MKHPLLALTIAVAVFLPALTSPAFAKPAKTAEQTSEEPSLEYSRKRPQYSLTDDQLRILEQGEISDGAYVGGGVVGTLVGLGIGHAIQGRYSNKGWIFTVGELGSYVVIVAGVGSCLDDAFGGKKSCDSGLIAAGLVGYIGFRIWEIIDVWVGGAEHNRTYRRLKARENEGGLSFYVLPLPSQSVAGLQFRF